MTEFASLAQAVLNNAQGIRYIHCQIDGVILSCSSALQELLPASSTLTLWELIPDCHEVQQYVKLTAPRPTRLRITWPGSPPENYLVAVASREFLMIADPDPQLDVELQLKSQFLTNMSHEIRTPLNAISGMAHLMLKTPLSLKQREYLRHILGGSQALVRIVNEMMDCSRLDSGHVGLTDFRVDTWAEGIRRKMQPEAQAKGLEFKLTIGPEVPTMVCADSARLQQVLLILLEDSLRLNDRGAISLEIHYVNSDTEHGRGLLECSLKAVQISVSLAGSVCQHLVSRMNGNLHDSIGPEATGRVVLTIPCTYRSLPLLAPPLTHVSFQRPGGPTEKVLIVEDNLANQRIVAELLSSYGIVSEIAQNGQEAVSRAQCCGSSEVWRLILMDLQMPVMDGFASASAIRCLEKFDDVPILAMTAHVFPEEQKRCLAVGMDGFLPKPIDLELWQAVLAHWLPISDAWPGRDHAMLEIDGVDTRSGLRRVTDNFELYSSLLRDFGSRIPQLSEQFATGAERADLSGLRTLAHSLRGEAGNLGAYQLAEQAADLERLARSQDIQGARVLVERLQASLSRLVKELQQNLPELLLSSSEDLDHNIAGPMLERLEIQLRQCEGGAVDTLHELWPHLGPLTTHGSAERLYRCVQEFDFCQAAQELQELKSQLGLNFTAPGQVG